ncbi:hypothetical protein A8990_1187 [Paenibacillus taihuensis]|uniref:Uncharacterized protein n=1 Tax=Paenibacillus taihuensis TaxID=1156355 RepID=A0A3D9RNJ1_9BACL|nr:hypothetical protein [Paenibacillus taihuensis]REE81483.1 hypothetical protein A8990_1187 [Paenibacillus taihuensis]
MNQPNKLSLTQRRIWLLLHILFASIMLGVQAVFIILALTASVTDNGTVLQSCYYIMHLLATSSVRASTIGTTVTGIILSVQTPWGLFRYYWIIAKEVLTLLAIVVGLYGLYEWTMHGLARIDADGLDAWHASGFTVNHVSLWVGIIIQTLSLIAMFILSIWKPGGKRKSRI